MRNIQQPEKRERHTGQVLAVHSIFPTIQGEGPFAGRPAVFLRLAGCNLQCPHCDTDYTSERRQLMVPKIVEEIKAVAGRSSLVVITGGEPFRQRLTILAHALFAEGFAVQIETNGTFHEPGFPYEQVTIVCSPKAGQINHKLHPHISALKYVISYGNVAEDDGLPLQALGHPAWPRLARPPEGFRGPIFVQPEDSQDEELNKLHLSTAVAVCLKYGYRLCLQVHKLIGVQ